MNKRYAFMIMVGILGLFVLIINYEYIFLNKKPIDVSCSVLGRGDTSCLYYNRSWLPASACVEIDFKQDQYYDGIKSNKLCSGWVMPQSNSTIDTRAAFTTDIMDYCLSGYDKRAVFSSGKKWTDYCTMEIVNME